MLNNNYERIGFVLNLIQLIENLFSFLAALIVSSAIVYNLYCGRLKRHEKITIILCAHIYVLVLILMIITTSMNINTLLGDLYKLNFDSSWCRCMGYLAIVVFCTLSQAFVNQAFYRLCRIVYPQYKRFQLFWLYVILPCIQLILSFILFYPLLLWHDVFYLPKEYYCYVKFSNLRGTCWILFNAYGIPVLVLSFIYIRITRFLRQQSNNQSLVAKRRQRRDLLITRRILITVGLLLVLGVPGVVLLIMRIIKGEEHPLSIRITYTFAALSITGLSISFILSIPQLKNIVLKKWKQEQIISIDNSLICTNHIRDDTQN
ncbi:unnamed protein product [Rotaria sp. Silwood2]|nr:unnamed protein product [Rotaria sp. Silwood2]CAF3130823.1 unnamed protein product [Rotaria sp. Silwood2]CAF4388681.1 unnamed protein product [Rotaria sp. Silwood2]